MFWHFVANNFLTLVSNMFTNLNLTTMETCYKCSRPEYAPRIVAALRPLRLRPRDHRAAGAHEVPLYEVPISYYGRDYPREEDSLEGRLRRHLGHPQVQPLGPVARVTREALIRPAAVLSLPPASARE